MRIHNLLYFTEHHRFYIFRDFSLSSIDSKMLVQIYQPMVGAFAIAMYQQLYHYINDGRTGYSKLEPLRKLLLGSGLEMNEQSRKYLMDQMSKLEAVGLLQTSRLAIADSTEVVYEFELARPLSPAEFFSTVHLAMLLRDKVGKYAVIELRESLASSEPDELAHAQLEKENISVPFYDLFKLNVQSFDSELEQALMEVAPARASAKLQSAEAIITFGELILRFPRNSGNRSSVERLRLQPDQLEELNYVAYKYHLSVADICRLLDEDGVFNELGKLQIDELQQRAAQMYRQDKKRDEQKERLLAHTQIFAGESAQAEPSEEEYEVDEQYFLQVPQQLATYCDIQQYNMLMRNEPYTHFIKRFFPGAVPNWLDQQLGQIDLNYKLPEPVINILIHYVIGSNDNNRITKTFIDAVASNMLMKRIDTFEKAVVYVREQARLELAKELKKDSVPQTSSARAGGARGSRSGASRKPIIPIVSDSQAVQKVSEDELEELRRLARKLDGKS
ncbi:DnaD domain protein [Paenibacillus sp. GXUN7292]|uniref:DnaD domain protein n=1 Tax=Paenibacillus sp. GXUN7292 TaxID=3422499 RepID=UPI003D7EAAB2